MKITSQKTSKEGQQSIEYIMKDGFIRVEMGAASGQVGVMIMDFKNQQWLMLMPQQRMYMVQPIPQAPADKGASTGPSPTGKPFGADVQVTSEKENILGYECTKIIATSPNGSAEIWVTDQLGSFMGFSSGAAGFGRRSQAAQAWETALKGKNFFPMRVIGKGKDNASFRLEVTSVQKESEPDSEFAPPDGWRKFDMGSMMGGALPGGYPGTRPSGNN